MKKKIILFSSIGGAILIAGIILLIILCMPKNKSYRNIKVFDTKGSVNVIRDNNTKAATKDMKLKNDDVVEVLNDSSTVLKLDDDKFIMAKANTTLRLIASGKKDNTKTRILVDKGGVIVEVKNQLKSTESFEIASSNSVMAIHGTQISFDVEVIDNKITTSVAVLEGKTKILLYKNEKLSSTTLNENYRFSYTTDLSEAASDISKVIETTTVEEIDDKVLEEVFNVIKEELSSEEIDNIIDIINTFEREDDLRNGVIKFTITNPGFGVDPKNTIEIGESYRDLVGLKYKYSKTVDGTFKEFSEYGYLEMGEWYCQITAGNAYRSEIIPFSVVKRDLTNPLTLTPIYYNGGAYLKAELNELEDFFKTDIAMTPSVTPNTESEYEYYIRVGYGDPDDSNGYKYFTYLDYDRFVNTGYQAISLEPAMLMAINYFLPDYFNIPESLIDFQLPLEDTLDIKQVVITRVEGEDTQLRFRVYADFYSTDNTSEIRMLGYVPGNTEVLEFEMFEGNTPGCYEAFIDYDEVDFYYQLSTSDVISKTYHYERTNMLDATSVQMSSSAPYSAIVTYNNDKDDTINFYYDMDFNGNNTFDYLAIFTYEDDAIVEERQLFAMGSTKYAVVKDAPNTSYEINYLAPVKVVDDIIYACKNVYTSDGKINDQDIYYGTLTADDGHTIATSYECFMKGGEIIIMDEDKENVIAVVTDDMFINDNQFRVDLDDYAFNICNVYARVYGRLDSDVAGTYGTTNDIFTKDAYEYLEGVLAEAGITLEGSYIHYVSGGKITVN